MAESPLKAKESGSALVISIHVQPRAHKNQIVGMHNGALKIKVTAPPTDHAANKAIIDFFASLLDLPRNSLKIIHGEKSRDKVLRIDSMTLNRFLSYLP